MVIMAALSIGPLFQHSKHSPIMICSSSRSHSRMLVSCRNRETNNTKTGKDIKEDKGFTLPQLVSGVKRLGKVVQSNLSPKQKGDWKDITLMSLSFAVYVYMSQKIVCAYCAWMSMLGQQW